MNRNVISKTISVLALSTAALFVGAAHADSTRISLSFGNSGQPACSHGYMDLRHVSPGQHHPVAWHDSRHHHDGFGPVSGIDRRQHLQQRRIVQGIRSGELTPFEARQLRQEQREIRHMERRYLADGRLSPAEWRRIDHELDQANRNIWRQKHDYQTRY